MREQHHVDLFTSRSDIFSSTSSSSVIEGSESQRISVDLDSLFEKEYKDSTEVESLSLAELDEEPPELDLDAALLGELELLQDEWLPASRRSMEVKLVRHYQWLWPAGSSDRLRRKKHCSFNSSAGQTGSDCCGRTVSGP